MRSVTSFTACNEACWNLSRLVVNRMCLHCESAAQILSSRTHRNYHRWIRYDNSVILKHRDKNRIDDNRNSTSVSQFHVVTRDCNPGIPTKFSNLVIPGLALSNPGIMGLKNCPLNVYKSVINDILWYYKWQLISAAVYVLYNFVVYKCDRVSLYVIIYLLFSVSCLCKLLYSVNLTSKLAAVCLTK